jgi:hypothetical protein
MRHKQLKISALTKEECEAILGLADFTVDQKRVFEAIRKNDRYDYAIIRDLNLPEKKYYDLKGIVVAKVMRIAERLGFDRYLC